MNVICDQTTADQYAQPGKEKDPFNNWSAVKLDESSNECITAVNYYGYEGCSVADLSSLFATFAVISGVVQIIGSCFLMAFGRAMIKATVTILLFFGISGGGFTILFNFGLVPGLD